MKKAVASQINRHRGLAILIAAILVLAFGMVTIFTVRHALTPAQAENVVPREIGSLEEFERYLVDPESGEFDMAGSYLLSADLDFTGLSASAGTDYRPFTGSFDGQGHTISGLQRPLFGVLMPNALVENLTLERAVITSAAIYGSEEEGYTDGYGILFGYAEGATIRNVGVQGELYASAPRAQQVEVAPEVIPTPAPIPGVPEVTAPVESETPAPEETPIVSETPDPEDTTAPESTPATSQEPEPSQAPEESTAPSESSAPETSSPETSQPETDDAGTPDDGGAEIAENQVPLAPLPDMLPGDEGTDTSEPSQDPDPVIPEAPQEPAEPSDDPEPSQEPADPTDEPTQAPDQEPADPTDEPTQEPEPTTAPDTTPEPQPTQGVDTGDDTYTPGGGTVQVERPMVEPTTRPTATPEPFVPGDFLTVTASSVKLGGLGAKVGPGVEITDCFTFVTVGADESSVGGAGVTAGGFIATLGEDSSVMNCYSTGLVDATGVSAGFIAENYGDITACFTTATMGLTYGEKSAFVQFSADTATVVSCAYDQQMACISDSYAAAMNTADMVGAGASLPGGTWYYTDRAYPQLNSFSTSSMSKASAIALVLPAGKTLADALTAQDEAIYLTPEVDGETANWTTPDGIIITDNGVAVVDDASVPSAPVTPAAPTAENGITLASFDAGDSVMPTSAEVEIPDEPVPQADGPEAEITTGSFTAELGGYTKSYDISLMALSSTRQLLKTVEFPKSLSAVSYNPKISYYGVAMSGGTITLVLQSSHFWDPTRYNYEMLGSNKTFLDVFTCANMISGDANGIPQELSWLSNGMMNSSTSITCKIPSGTTYKYVTPIARPTANNNQTEKYLAQSFILTPPSDWQQIGKYVEEGSLTSEYYPKPTKAADGYYEIKSAYQLAWCAYIINNDTSNKYGSTGLKIRLMNNIDLAGTEFGLSSSSPLPWVGINSFAGTFDGNGYTISNLKGTSSTYGLFNSTAATGVIQNLTIGSGSINPSGTTFSIGGIVGSNSGTVQRCTNRADVTAGASGHMMGGIVGSGGTVMDCINLGTVNQNGKSGNSWAGGIATTATSVTNCYNGGKLIGADHMGYIVSGMGTNPVNCYIDLSLDHSGLDGRTEYIKGTALDGNNRFSPDIAVALNAGRSGDNAPWRYMFNQYPALVMPGVVSENWLNYGFAKAQAPTSGNGTKSSPYLIGSAGELSWLLLENYKGNTTLSAKMTADINLNDYSWLGFKNYANTFDGNWHTISNMKGNGCTYGLFNDTTTAAVIQNLTIGSGSSINPTVNSKDIPTGGIVGDNRGLIQRCTNYANVSTSSPYTSNGNWFRIVGGIAGENGTITDCINLGTVTNGKSGSCWSGGIVSRNAIVTNCYNAGRLVGGSDHGAIVSIASPTGASTGSVTNCVYDNTLNHEFDGRTEYALGTALDATTRYSSSVVDQLNANRTGEDAPWHYRTSNYPYLFHPIPQADLNVSISPSATATWNDGKSYSVSVTGGSGTGALSYTSSNTSVAKFNSSSSGAITVVGSGSTTITVTKAASGDYSAATKTINFTVNPGTQTAPGAPTFSGSTGTSITVNNAVSGYEYYWTTSTAKPTDATAKLGTASGTSYTITGLTAGQTYYVYARKPATSALLASPWSAAGSKLTGIPVTGVTLNNYTPTFGYAITATVAPAGAVGEWKWERSTSNASTATWTTITGANSASYTPNTSADLNCYFRATFTGNGTTYVGSADKATTSVLKLASQTAPDKPTSTGHTNTSITIGNAASGIEYYCSASATAPGTGTAANGGKATASGNFTINNLASYTQYYIWARRAATTGYNASDWTSSYLSVKTSGTFTSLTVGASPKVGVSFSSSRSISPDTAAGTWKWERCTTTNGSWAAITGATSSSYTPVAGDVGYYLRVTFTPSGDYYPTFKTSVASTNKVINGTQAAPATPTSTAHTNTSITISNAANGIEYYYSTSTTAPGTSTAANGGTATGSAWAINGLTANTQYYIWARRAYYTGYNASNWSSSYLSVKTSGTLTSVSISGSPKVGVACSAATTTTPSTTAGSYKWERSTSNITGGTWTTITTTTTNSYTPVAADAGYYLRVTFTPNGDYYPKDVTSVASTNKVADGTQAAPTGLTGVAANAATSGYINGTTTAMQYNTTSATNTGTWTTCSVTKTNVSVGNRNVYVRYAAKTGYSASPATTVNIPIGTQAEVNASFESGSTVTSKTVNTLTTGLKIYPSGGSSGGAFSYFGNNDSVATVDTSGNITIKKAGTVSFYVQRAADSNGVYATRSSSNITLTVGNPTWADVGNSLTQAGAGVNGSGTSGSPYKIGSAEGLAWFMAQVNGGQTTLYAELTANVDLAGKTYSGETTIKPDFTNCIEWVPINNSTVHFNGGGHYVENLYIKNGKGFFAGISGSSSNQAAAGIIQNLGIQSGSINGSDNVGALVGSLSVDNLTYKASIERCWNNASVSGSGKEIGGLVGWQQGIIKDCYNTGNVSAVGQYAGGIVGTTTSVSGASITNCYNTGNVSASAYAGAIAGWHNATTKTNNNFYLAGSSVAAFGISSGNAAEKTEDQLKSWGAAYQLNGAQSTFANNSVWKYTANQYPTFGTLPAAADWSAVGNWVDTFATAQKPTGEANYMVGNAEGLAWFMTQVNGGKTSLNATLTANIELIGAAYGGSASAPLKWVPIGNTSTRYAGTIDGGGHVIDYLTIASGTNIGLVGYADGVTIKNLGIGTNSKITGSDYVAAFIGICTVGADNRAVIQNCFNRATVVSQDGHCGAFIGDDSGRATGSSKARIENSYNAGDTPAFAKISNGTITNCFADTTAYASSAIYEAGTGSVTDVTTAQLQSWGAAYQLNEAQTNFSSNNVWKYTAGQYPTFGTLTAASDWGVVADWVDAFAPTKKPGGSPYSISTPEALAWYANKTTGTGSAKLTANIDLTGAAYGGTGANLLWKSMSSLSGTLEGQMYQISPLYSSTGGLIDSITSTGKVNGLGIYSGAVSRANSVGAVANTNAGLITNCWNRAAVNSTGSTTDASGIVGVNNGKIVNCYNLGTIKGYNASGIAATGAGSDGKVSLCYNAGTLTGTSNSYGLSRTGNTVTYSYWKGSNISGGSGLSNCGALTQEQMQSSGFATDLNARLPLGATAAGVSVSDLYPWSQTGANYPVLNKGITLLTGVTLNSNAPVVGTQITGTPAPAGATATYKWERSSNKSSWTTCTGANPTTLTYTPNAADVGMYLRLTVVGTGSYAGTVSATATAAVAKATQTAPAKPSISSYTDKQIVLNVVKGQDYYYNTTGTAPSASTTPSLKNSAATGTTNLTVTQNTTYYFWTRLEETDDKTASPWSPVTSQKTKITVTNLSMSSGTPTFGKAVTATPTPNAATGAYQWQYAASTSGPWTNCTGSGAATNSYTPNGTDVGKYLQVTFTPSGSSDYYGTQTAVTTSVVAKAEQAELKLTMTPNPVIAPNTVTLAVTGGSTNGTVTYEVVSGGTGAATISGSTLTPTKAGTVYVKATMAGNGSYLPISGTWELTINRGTQAAPTTVAGVAANGAASAYLKNTTAAMEYKRSTDSTWKTCGASTTALTTAGTYYVRYAQTDLYDVSAYQTVTVSLGTQSTVTGSFSATATETSKTVKFTDTGLKITAGGGNGAGAYKFTGNNDAVASINQTSGAITIKGTGTVTFFVTRGGDAMYADKSSGTLTLTVEAADTKAPTGLSGVAADKGTSGYISGTATAMEYNTSETATTGWTTCKADKTPLAGGTYYVRYAAKSGYAASPAVKITIARGTQSTVTATLSPGSEVLLTATGVKLTAGGGNAGAYTYYSKNTDVATIDGSGNITLHKLGSATFYVKRAGDVSYNEATSADVTLTVKAGNWQDVGKSLTQAGAGVTGSGTAESPYQIGSAEGMAWFMAQVNGGKTTLYAQLTSNIDLSGKSYTGAATVNADFSNCLEWTPIATSTVHFDGGGHYVENLYIKNGNGFFSSLSGSASGQALAGTAHDFGIYSGAINGPNDVGSIVGNLSVDEQIYKASIERCWNNATVTGSGKEVGGLVGWTQGIIKDCYNTGNVSSAGQYAGGIVGSTTSVSGASITNCYNTGNVSASAYAGAIAGWHNATTKTSNNFYLTGSASQAFGMASGAATAMTESQLQSWGAAYQLNGAQTNFSSNNVWKYTAGQYPTFGTLPAAADWSVVANWVDTFATAKKPTGDGTSATPYQIGTPEALAWYANKAGGSKNAELTENISLLGEAFGGTGSNMRWVSMPSLSGTLEGGMHEITSLRSSTGGLVNEITSTGKVNGLGIYSGVVSRDTYVGAIANDSAGLITNCWNMAEVNSTGTATDAAGIAGINSGKIVNCYNTGTLKGVSVSGITGTGSGSGQVSLCYNAGTLSGTSTSYGLSRTGSKVTYSYWKDSTANGGNGLTNCSKYTEAQMKAVTFATELNAKLPLGATSAGVNVSDLYSWNQTAGSYPHLDKDLIKLTGVTLNSNAPVATTAISGTLTPANATATYKWERSVDKTTWADCTGANPTTLTYTPNGDDVGKYLRLTVVGTGSYAGTVSATATAAVVKATQTAPTVTFNSPFSGQTLAYGKTGTISVTGGTNITGSTVSFVSNKPEVATVSAGGVVTPTGIGTATITITKTGGNEYTDWSMGYNVTTIKGTQGALTFTFSVSNTATWGDGKNHSVSASGGGGTGTGAVSYTVTSGGTYIDVNSSTGAITVKAAGGSATIKATKPGGDYYNDVSATTTFTVKRASITKVTLSPAAAAKDPMIGTQLTAETAPKDATGGWQWQRSTDGSSWSNITDATNSTYTPVAADYNYHLRVIFTPNGNYDTQTASTKTSNKVVKIPQAEPTVNMGGDYTLSNGKFVYKYGTTDATIAVSGGTNTGGAITFSSGNASVFTVDETSGKIAFTGLGDGVEIRFTKKGNDTYADYNGYRVINVVQGTQKTLTATLDKTTAYVGGTVNLTVGGGSGNGVVTYESSDESVATIGSDGKITLMKAGDVTFTVKKPGLNVYNDVEATAQLTVLDSVYNVTVTPRQGKELYWVTNTVFGATSNTAGAIVDGGAVTGVTITHNGASYTATPEATLVDNYYAYGTVNANAKLGFRLVGKTAANADAKYEIDQTGNVSMSKLNTIVCYNAAAYNIKTDEVYVLTVHTAGGTDLTINVTVKGVTSKTVSVSVPKNPHADINLQTTTSYSNDCTVKNLSAFPVKLSLTGLTQIADGGAEGKVNATVPLASHSADLNTEVDVVDSGVKFTLTNAAGKTLFTPIKYEPNTFTSSLISALGSDGQVPYRIQLEHGLVHLGEDVTFGYTINFGYTVSDTDAAKNSPETATN